MECLNNINAHTIQKAYKCYREDKYLKFIGMLPCELIQKILFYVMLNFNARRRQLVSDHLCKSFDDLLRLPKPILRGSDFTGFYCWNESMKQMKCAELCKHTHEITRLYKLYSVYMTITNVRYHKLLYHFRDKIRFTIVSYITYYKGNGSDGWNRTEDRHVMSTLRYKLLCAALQYEHYYDRYYLLGY